MNNEAIKVGGKILAVVSAASALFFVVIIALHWKEGSATANAEATVKSMLTDPSSAQFQSVRTVKGTHGIVVCGQVNARNQLGGYVGFRDFVFDDFTKYAVLLTGNWSDRARVWKAHKDRFSLCGVSEEAAILASPDIRASDFRR